MCELDFSNVNNFHISVDRKDQKNQKDDKEKKNTEKNKKQANAQKAIKNAKPIGATKNNKNDKNYKNNYRSDASYEKKEEKNTSGVYIGAPYNFVPFKEEKRVYSVPDTPTPHNSVADNLLSGEISYEFESKTPVFVDDGTDSHHFHKNAWGEYSIPGSSIRGLIRNNVQILGFSSFADDIDDYALMYRNVANGAEKKTYNKILGSTSLPLNKGKNISVLKNVKAGYIKKEGSHYVIHQTCVDKIKQEYGERNYYILNERKIAEEKRNGNRKFSYDFLIQNGRELTQNLLDEEFVPYKDKNGNQHYEGQKNPFYRPGFEAVSYEMKELQNVTNLGKEGKYSKRGYLIRTGFMKEKKAIYVIPEIAMEKPVIRIPEKDIEAFRIDFKKRENTIQKGIRDFFDLPKEDNQIKPVFYIEYGGRLYFGFTPRLRLFYDHTIKEGIPKNQKARKLDYAKAIFGYSDENGSYRSRVSFSDAVAEPASEEGKEYSVILAEPKPTSYLDYLDQTKGTVSYNTDSFQLRGVKQYWLHREEQVDSYDGNKDNVMSVLHPLKKGTCFRGTVRFQNLKEDELGLLLWAIRLETASWMNLGKAKAYGFGNVQLKNLKARKLDMKKAYFSDHMLNLDPFQPIDTDRLIEKYKQQMAAELKINRIEDSGWIRSFLAMKDSTRIPAPEKIRYMSITKNEYQNRTIPLQSIDEVCKKSKG